MAVIGMQRLLTQPAVRRALPLASDYALRAASPTAELHAALAITSSLGAATKRSFGSERHWTPRSSEESVLATERYNGGAPLIEFWENDLGALVAQHDELEDIDCCRWAIKRVCERLCQPEPKCTPEQKCKKLMALRFLLDLEDRIEELSNEGYGTCAIDIFERPWVLTCADDTEILRLRPRPDGLIKRAAFAALSPVIAPMGALATYVKSGSANSVAAFKWYFRAIAELPTKVELDNSYRVEGSYSDLEACAASLTFHDLRRLISVQREVPQLI